MEIYITSDHSGINQRHELISYLEANGMVVHDLGTEDCSSNYAQLGIKLGEMVVNNPGSLGIVMCGTGIGISIATNKVKGVRCALVDRVENAHLVREHNNANVLSLGARTTTIEEMKQIVNEFLKTEFEGGRHEARIQTISDYETQN